jgi:hypothetical protein
MEPREEPLRDRLLAQPGPTTEQLARYRQEVEALLGHLRRRKWWADAARAVLTTLGAVVLFPLAVLLGLMALYLVAGGRPVAETWLPAAAGAACLAAAVVLVKWFFRRRGDDLLLEVKRLQAQGLEFEEQLRSRNVR